MEKLDIRTSQGKVTGVVKERDEVHRNGDIHGTSHVWLIRKKQNKKFDILLTCVGLCGILLKES